MVRDNSQTCSQLERIVTPASSQTNRRAVEITKFYMCDLPWRNNNIWSQGQLDCKQTVKLQQEF